MADSAIDKLKEQYVELILHSMPLSQMFFLVIMAIIFDGLLKDTGTSPLGVISGVNIKNAFNLEEGLVWNIPLKFIFSAFFVSVLNIFFINKFLRRSFLSSDVAIHIPGWHSNALRALAGLSAEQRLPIQASLSEELTRRIKKFNTKRLVYELFFSMAVCIILGSIYLIYLNLNNFSKLEISVSNSAFCIFCLVGSFLLNRNSINYAISKIISLKVMLSATTGELVFFEGIS